jgi:hypothetical protein
LEKYEVADDDEPVYRQCETCGGTGAHPYVAKLEAVGAAAKAYFAAPTRIAWDALHSALAALEETDGETTED